LVRRIVTLAMPALLAAAPVWGEPCAPSLVSIDSDEPFEVHEARFDTTGGSGGTAYAIFFDLGEGFFETRMTSNEFGRTEIRSSDRYQIDAAFSGPAVIDAVLEVTAVRFNSCGLECAWAMTRIEWREEAGGSVDHLADTQQAGVYHFEMTLPVTVTFGVPFTLETVIETQVRGLGANLFARADVSTRLRFDRLPAGARVRSCRGFDSAPHTPTAHASWGGVKARYR